MASINASCLFALFPAYVLLMPEQAQSGNWLAAQRIVWSCVILMFGLGYFGQFKQLLALVRQWRMYPIYALAALLVGCQFWLFLWAPTQGQTLSVALGYFALPLVLVVVGRFVYQERLRFLQWIAVAIASCGVAYAYLLAQGLSWIVLMVALGYPMYFMLRRRYPLPSHLAFSLDNLFLLPVAIIYILSFHSQIIAFEAFSAWIYYLGLGVLGSISMLLFLLASRSLSLTIFGLMSYLEPTLVFAVGWLLGERLDPGQWPIYLLIVLALLVLATDGLIHIYQQRRAVRPSQ
ncbi:EamA family transporter RarD [Alginatibacterium sediminis]|uniref:EamA family transporter RarD n=1 Tax=Alginatibacterium sediminis TaxID=2164068 RepID=A0A420EID9_9ALTE|nr:EamA family transporter RarD [Alginatibacterium sediminis]